MTFNRFTKTNAVLAGLLLSGVLCVKSQIPLSTLAGKQGKWLIKSPFDHNVFIENKGQFLQEDQDSVKQAILYYTHKGKLNLYFSATALTFGYDSAYRSGNDDDASAGKEEEGNMKILPVYLHMNWQGANPNTWVEVQNPVSDYFTYRDPRDHTGHTSIKANAWQKLIYHNLYKNIDVEFYYPKNKEGLEYDIIVHPGGNLSQVKMHYSGNAHLSLVQNEVKILSPCAHFADHAPVAKDENGVPVISNFSVTNNVVSFQTGNYDKNKTLVIDPVLTTTSFTGTNKAYNIDYDLAGNLYVMGGGDATEFQLQKYNALGSLLWTYTSTFAYNFHNDYYYGGFTTDNRSGSSYIAEGLDFSGSGSLVEKVNAAGALVTTFPGNNTLDEIWAIAFDYCDNQLIIGAGEANGSVNAGAILDTGCTNAIPVNVLNAPPGDSHHDMCMIAFDGVGKCYMTTTTPASNAYKGQGFGNVLLQMPSATLVPTAYQVSDRSNFIETASIPYYPSLVSNPYLYCGNEFNGLAADLNMVITYDGQKIRKWTPANGLILDSVTVTPNQQLWGGIVLDCQDNIYVGEQTSFSIYNSSLGLISTTLIGAGDTVYDLKLSPANIVYTCGNDFIAANPVAIPRMITATATPATNCQCNGSATVTSVCDDYPYTYSWSDGQTTSTATGLCAGTYTVTVKDAACIPRSDTAIVHISGGAGSLIITPTVVNIKCFDGNNGSATITVTGGTSPYTYSWSPGSQTNANAIGLSAGVYTVTITDKNGCTTTDTISITQPPKISIITTTDSANCNQANGSATATASGGTGPYVYSWNPSAQTNTTATGLGVGTYTVTVTDKNGCTETASATVNSLNGETATMGTITNINCNGGTNGSAMVNVTGGVTPYIYSWSPTGQTNATAIGLSAGTYTVTVTDKNGCKSSAIGTITQPSPIVISAANQTITCFGQSVTLTASATGGAGGPYTYVWMPGAITGSSITVSPSNSTNYTVTATDANGCTGTAIVSVTVAQSAMLTVTPALSICQGSSVILIANGAPGTYTWQPGNLSGTSITVTPSVTTTYTVSLTNNCGTITDTVTVTVSPNPTVRFISDILQGCAPLCVQFRDETSGNIVQWSWNFGNGATSNQEDPVYCFKNPGQYSVSLTTSTNIGCSSTLKIQDMITVFSHPDAAFSYSPKPATIMDPMVQFIDLSTDSYGIISWFWTFGDATDSTSTLENPEHTYQDTGYYCASLIVMNEHGCTDTATDCLPLEPFPTLYIPSAFTPNGDGLNEVFTAKGEYIKSFEMYIFDRWGMQLYHTNSIDKGWDGTVGGGSAIAQEDIYVYLIYVTDDLNKTHKYIGRVTLLK